MIDAVLRFVLTHLAEILIGVLCFIFFYHAVRRLLLSIRSLFRLIRRVPGYKLETPGTHLLVSLICWGFCFLMALFIAFSVVLDLSYQPIAGANKVGTLSSHPGHLVFRPANGYPGTEYSIKVTTRQWAIRGHFLVFKSFLTYAGLHSSHRIDELVGRDEIRIPDVSRTIAKFHGSDPFFDFLTRFNRYIPFVNATTITSPYLDSSTGPQTLYVFDGGYVFLAPRVRTN